MSTALMSLISLLFLAAITPGPNNFIVLGLSIKKGLTASVVPILAILLGTQFVLLLVSFGFDAVFKTVSWSRPAMILIGGSFLLWASIKMIVWGNSNVLQSTPKFTHLGLFFFQILNPKTWILVGTSFAAFRAMATQENFHAASLSLIVLLITTPCLLAWALVGQYLKTRMIPDFALKYIYSALGIAMMVSVVGLITVA